MKYSFSHRSLKSLDGVDDRLVILASYALATSPVDFVVLEGIRSVERQKELLESGKSKTMKSKHLIGKALDIVPYPIEWDDITRFRILGEHIKACAWKLGFNISWGGDWKTFKDFPHYQIED